MAHQIWQDLAGRITFFGALKSIWITLETTIQKNNPNNQFDINKKWGIMAAKLINGFKEVPKVSKLYMCFWCDFRSNKQFKNCLNYDYCKDHNCIFVKENQQRKSAWETISDYFEDHYEREDRHGGDMVAVAQDAIVADDLYLAFKIDDLRNLEAEDFKTEVIKLLKDFE